jgi:uncharacterized coiled-coil DUF342 family protein
MVSDAELKRQINKIKDKFETKWQALDDIYGKIKSKHDEITEYKTRRDELNQLVKTLIVEAKERQKERDSLQESIKPKREVIKNLRLNIKEYAIQINDLKNIRAGKHREAKGSLEGLKNNVADSLTTLLILNLSLKDEITLFNMIFATKQRYQAKSMAEDIHKQIQDIYNALKESERQIQNTEVQIAKIVQDSQILHNESISRFKEKDEVRNKSTLLHQQVVGGYKEIKDLRAQTGEIKKILADLKGELNVLYKKLRANEKRRQEITKKERLQTAKEKLKGERKMGLDELRLLVESGSLKKEK